MYTHSFGVPVHGVCDVHYINIKIIGKKVSKYLLITLYYVGIGIDT